MTEKDFTESSYGIMPLIQSKDKINRQLVSVHDIDEKLANQVIWIRGRLHTSRGGGKQCFLIIRHELATIQVVVSVNQNVSKDMIKFVTTYDQIEKRLYNI